MYCKSAWKLLAHGQCTRQLLTAGQTKNLIQAYNAHGHMRVVSFAACVSLLGEACVDRFFGLHYCVLFVRVYVNLSWWQTFLLKGGSAATILRRVIS